MTNNADNNDAPGIPDADGVDVPESAAPTDLPDSAGSGPAYWPPAEESADPAFAATQLNPTVAPSVADPESKKTRPSWLKWALAGVAIAAISGFIGSAIGFAVGRHSDGDRRSGHRFEDERGGYDRHEGDDGPMGGHGPMRGGQGPMGDGNRGVVPVPPIVGGQGNPQVPLTTAVDATTTAKPTSTTAKAVTTTAKATTTTTARPTTTAAR